MIKIISRDGLSGNSAKGGINEILRISPKNYRYIQPVRIKAYYLLIVGRIYERSIKI